jgi:hypothetical protein
MVRGMPSPEPLSVCTNSGLALARGAWQTVNLLVRWLEPGSRAHLHALAQAYTRPSHPLPTP